MLVSFKSEMEKISQMDKKNRIDYFRTYYLKPCIAIVVFLIMFVWFIADTMFKKDAACNGCVYGIELTDSQKEALTTGFLEYYNLNPKDYSAAVATDNMFEGTAQQMDANSHEMALFAQIAAGEIYYLILDKATLEMMSNGGVYAGLNEVLPQETCDKLKGMTYTLDDYETGEPYEAAINLEELGFLDEEGYLVFTIARPDEDFPLKFYEYLSDISR